MHWLDTSILFVLTGAAAFGFVFGFLKPLFRLGLIVAAMVTAAFLTPIIIGVVNDNANAGYPSFPLISLLFVVALTIYATAFILIRRQIWKAVPDLANTLAKLHWFDRLIGAAVAVVLAGLGICLLLCLSHRVSSLEFGMRFHGSRVHRETMTRFEPQLKQLPEWQKSPFRPPIDWLKKAGETPLKAPSTVPTTAPTTKTQLNFVPDAKSKDLEK